MPIDSHLPQADPFSLVPTFKAVPKDQITIFFAVVWFGSTPLPPPPLELGEHVYMFGIVRLALLPCRGKRLREREGGNPMSPIKADGSEG